MYCDKRSIRKLVEDAIDEAAEKAGLKVLDGDHESVMLKDVSSGREYHVRYDVDEIEN